MNGEGVRYPAFLIGGPHARPAAFNGPEGLFVSSRHRPSIGDKIGEVLVDSAGQSWTLHTITAVGRWGSWNEQLSLWWKRRYRVEYGATEGPAVTIEDVKSRLISSLAKSGKELHANLEVEKRWRWRVRKEWEEYPDKIQNIKSWIEFERAIYSSGISSDGWFRSYGRSNREEYIVVVIPTLTLMGSVRYFGVGVVNLPAVVASIIAGIILPGLLLRAAVERRLHDFEFRGTILYFPIIVMFYWFIVECFRGGLHFTDWPGWVVFAICAILVLALAIPPGTKGRNYYGPPPNPGPSL